MSAPLDARAEEPRITLEPPMGPVGAEASERRAQSLASELRAVAEKHGPGAVVLQAGFLIEAMRAGAVGPTEVRVVGPSERHGAEFLEIDVGTGLIFDADSTDVAGRTDRVWAEIVAPVLSKMETFAIEPSGLALVFGYGTQRFSTHAERKADLSAPQEAHTARFVIPAAALEDLALDRVSIGEFRGVATTLVD
jgi:hypothetical protein